MYWVRVELEDDWSSYFVKKEVLEVSPLKGLFLLLLLEISNGKYFNFCFTKCWTAG